MSLKLPTPDDFTAFPFKPYDIQLDLMRQVFSAIEDKKVAIMESPTGTVSDSPALHIFSLLMTTEQGKTLSLLCASLTWLKDEQQRARTGQLEPDGESTDGDMSSYFMTHPL